MSKIFYCSIAIVTAALLFSCKKPTDGDRYTSIHPNAVYLTFADGSGFFNPEETTPYRDTIRFVFPSHYPADTDHPIDISQMKLNTVRQMTITPASGQSGFIDLRTPTAVSIQYPDGSTRTHIVAGEIRKSPEAKILSFTLSQANLQGFISEDKKEIGLVAGGMEISGQQAQILFSRHATIYPDPSVPQDFSRPVTYTVTAEDGTVVQYTVSPVSPGKIPAGIRRGSQRLLWTKTLTELGIDGVNHMTTSIALSGDQLVVNTREIPNRYFNRFNGSFEGTMVMGGINAVPFQNFFASSDQTGNILISNLTTAAGNTLYVYKWKGAADPNPEKYIEWVMDTPGWQVGRKLSVKGNLDQDAVIYLTASNSGNTILRWEVKGGILQSQGPVKLTYPGEKKWTLMADAVPVGNTVTDDLFISGMASDIAFMRTSDGSIPARLDLAGAGYADGAIHSIDHVMFNQSRYLAAVNIFLLYGYTHLYDVTDPLALGTAPSSAAFSDVHLFRVPDIPSASNGNRTGDVLFAVSADGYKLIMYTLVTNGGITAYEFDCIDINSL